jgi:hypothetical protein
VARDPEWPHGLSLHDEQQIMKVNLHQCFLMSLLI